MERGGLSWTPVVYPVSSGQAKDSMEDSHSLGSLVVPFNDWQWYFSAVLDILQRVCCVRQ